MPNTVLMWYQMLIVVCVTCPRLQNFSWAVLDVLNTRELSKNDSCFAREQSWQFWENFSWKSECLKILDNVKYFSLFRPFHDRWVASLDIDVEKMDIF